MAGFHDLIRGDGEYLPCVHPWADLWVNAAGKATCCTQNRTALGDVHSQDLSDIWNSPAAQGVRAAVAAGDYEAAGCQCECPYLRGASRAPRVLPPVAELINAEFDLPDDDTAYARNIRQVLADYRARRTRVESRPVFVDIQAVLRCNADCFMCGQPHKSKLAHGPETLAKLASLKPTAQYFRFQGGEVFMNKDFYAYLAAFDNAGNPHLRRYVISNGTLLGSDRIHGLLANETPIMFMISVDGVSAATFAQVRKQLDFRRAYACLEELAELQRRTGQNDLVRWNYLVMQATLAEMRPAIEQAAAWEIELNFAALQGEYAGQNLFRYAALAPPGLADQLLALQSYAARIGARVSGFEGLLYRLEVLGRAPAPRALCAEGEQA